MKDIIDKYKNKIDYQRYCHLTAKSLDNLQREHWQPLLNNLSALESVTSLKPDWRIFNNAVIEIGSPADLSESQHQLLETIIKQLIPWRKGPYSLFGHFIDTEWNSDLKWQRLKEFIPDLDNKRVVDIGCNNGYYMWRLLGHALAQGQSPELILGLDPSEIFYFSFELFQKFIKNEKVSYRILGVEELDLFPKFFDLALYLGVIYHQRDPLGSLIKIKESLRPGAKLILETIIYPGEEDAAYFIKDRYAKMRNVYFLPTKRCLVSWLEKTGFKEIKISDEILITNNEQRKTAYMPYESLEDFLDPQDPAKTIEGLPAPNRVIVTGEI